MKTAIFVDVQNIYHTVKSGLKGHFNYTAFWGHVSKHNQIDCAYAYAIEPQGAKQQQFQQLLRTIGFTVKLKPYIQRQDGSAKGDWDVGITIDVLEIAPKVEKIILLSGDGDFTLLIDKVNTKFNTKTEVFGVECLTANTLINAAQAFYAIDDALILPIKK